MVSWEAATKRLPAASTASAFGQNVPTPVAKTLLAPAGVNFRIAVILPQAKTLPFASTVSGPLIAVSLVALANVVRVPLGAYLKIVPVLLPSKNRFPERSNASSEAAHRAERNQRSHQQSKELLNASGDLDTACDGNFRVHFDSVADRLSCAANSHRNAFSRQSLQKRGDGQIYAQGVILQIGRQSILHRQFLSR